MATTLGASNVTGTHQVVFALRQHGEDMERAVSAELDVLAQMAASRMRALAPKWRSFLTDSILVSSPDAMTREISPGMAYAEAVEKGVKPGGKGLPRFFDPASASIVAWLQTKAFAGQGRVRKGTGRFTARELMLRDRYEGLAWHVRHKGIKAQPFVAPTAKEMEPVVLSRLDMAVRRVLAARPDGAGTSV
jgi:hypothetical protein